MQQADPEGAAQDGGQDMDAVVAAAAAASFEGASSAAAEEEEEGGGEEGGGGGGGKCSLQRMGPNPPTRMWARTSARGSG